MPELRTTDFVVLGELNPTVPLDLMASDAMRSYSTRTTTKSDFLDGVANISRPGEICPPSWIPYDAISYGESNEPISDAIRRCHAELLLIWKSSSFFELGSFLGVVPFCELGSFL